MNERREEFKALVGKIVEGKHGKYAVAHQEDLGTVTFALSSDVWNEGEVPARGTFVMLSDLQKKKAGWRAMKARFYKPSDEASQSKQQTGKGNKQ